MRFYWQIFSLILLLYSCYDGLSNRGAIGFIDQTVKEINCAEQTSPSLQCPGAGPEDEEKSEDEELGEGSGSGGQYLISGPPQLTEYKDGKWGSVAVSPVTLKKGEEAQLQMTFTAAKAIAQENTPVRMVIYFPHPNTGFKLSNVEVSPAAAEDFFENSPWVDTSPARNNAIAPIMNMDAGEKFTLTFTITPQQDFEVKAATNTHFFKNSRGEHPKITVYTGSTAPVIAHDLSPIYTNGKLEMRLKPWPHKIKKNTATELTLTFTAVIDLRRRSKTNKGQLTHDVHVGPYPRKMISTYRVKSLTPRTYFKDGKKPSCNANYKVAHSCDLEIVEMQEGESFELKLTVKASEDFSLGALRKKHDDINPELNGELPQIKVK